jgi:acyl-CoA dehydrogenase
MNFSETEADAEIRDAVRRLCREFCDDYWRNCDEQHRFPWDFCEAMAKGGWVGIAIPEEYGGGAYRRVRPPN